MPDLERYNQLVQEAERLQEAGRWSQTAYDEIVPRAAETVADLPAGKAGDLLAFFYRLDPELASADVAHSEEVPA